MNNRSKILTFAIGLFFSLNLNAENAVSITGLTPLFLKPVFELTEKDQVLLDILHSDKIIDIKEDFSCLEEKNGVYPEAFEKAYTRFLELLNNSRPTRRIYLDAVEQAAGYLASLLSPDAAPDKADKVMVNDASHITYQNGDLATLLIGINYEGTNYQLENCVHDIEHVMNQLLMPQLKAKKGQMIFMSDRQHGTDLYPTANNIRKQLDHFIKNLNNTKQGYFHYSGHGSYVRDKSGDEMDKRDEVLVPIDADYSGYLTDDEMFERFIRRLTSDVKLTVTSDSCHSGTVLDLPYKWNLDGSYSVESKLSSQEIASLPDVVLLSGCRDNQTSADGGVIPGENKGAGAMTAAYLQTLKDHNFVLTYRQLLKGIRDHLKKEGFSQRPQLTSTRLLNLDDYFLSSQVSLRP